ncbi:GNAT family N-acetyltransferase [Candidatus Magnetomonas plexicatena]|uniref:GNAT family N-acetyltransferase n=1 Tax=Candidatus Magnetomonas plexicatena TaxID=2552947 RepID=UPI0011031D00|nr:GNAT family N-acetyltransferase [Nitrospirales bacterium LBB_01]
MTTDELKDYLQNGARFKIKELNVKNGTIEYIAFDTMTITNLADDDFQELYNFFYEGLSEQSRVYFPFYPLLRPQPETPQTVRERIVQWRVESDWFFYVLKDGVHIIGVSLLKRISTGHPVAGIAIADKYHKRGLGTVMLKAAIAQAKLLNLYTIYSGVAPDNDASYALHTKCGFVLTGQTMPYFVTKNGENIIARHDKELILQVS